tara:strand:+ start:8880 stop:9677 length:798 start_codon:yes stop_codon:yes gene_type:complete
MSKKVIIIQPGKLGDILILAPVAKHYHDLGYEVQWPVYRNFLSTIERFPYVKPLDFGVDLHNYYNQKRSHFSDQENLNGGINIFKKIYEYIDSEDVKVVDPCFYIPGHNPKSVNYKKALEYKSKNISWIQLKYDLAGVDIEKRWELEYERDNQKEDKLMDLIEMFCEKKNMEDYSIVHTYDRNLLSGHNIENEIPFTYIEGFTIFDWYKALENSSSLYCIDSCLANYVEVSKFLENKEKYYLGTEEKHYVPFMKNILKNNWSVNR